MQMIVSVNAKTLNCLPIWIEMFGANVVPANIISMGDSVQTKEWGEF